MNRRTLQTGIIALVLITLSLSGAAAQDAPPETPPLVFAWQHLKPGYFLDGNLWSPDNRYLAMGSPEQDAVLLIDRETWTVDRRLPLPATESPLYTLWWSPDGAFIALDSLSDTIVLRVDDGSAIQISDLLAQGNTNGALPNHAARWMGDDVLAVLTATEGKATIDAIDVTTREVVREIDIPDYNGGYSTTSFDWSPQSGLFAAPFEYTGSIGFWNAEGSVSSGLVQRDATQTYRLASQCQPSGDDTTAPEFDFSGMESNRNLTDMAWSHDGTRLAFSIYVSTVVCTLNPELTAVSQLQQLHIPNAGAGYDVLSSPYSEPWRISWGPDDRWLLASPFFAPSNSPDQFCGMAVFDAEQDFAYVGRVGESFCVVWNMSWSPDGQQLVVAVIGDEPNTYWIGTLQPE